MNALINLNDCREYTTITLNNENHQIKLAGTPDDPFFCGLDICKILGYQNPKKILHENVKDKNKHGLAILQKVVPGGGGPLCWVRLNH
jgi:prophage antirepressor-like protein